MSSVISIEKIADSTINKTVQNISYTHFYLKMDNRRGSAQKEELGFLLVIAEWVL